MDKIALKRILEELGFTVEVCQDYNQVEAIQVQIFRCCQSNVKSFWSIVIFKEINYSRNKTKSFKISML